MRQALRSLPSLAAIALLVAAPSVSSATGVAITSSTFGGIEARALGPATMSGRISSLDVTPGDPLTVWVGAASGGVWKSEDAGLTFEPVFDDYPQSVGVIRVDPSNPDTVWVGTGEPWTRNSVSMGFGVYKTTDGGETWNLMGIGGYRADQRDPDRSDRWRHRLRVRHRPSLGRQ